MPILFFMNCQRTVLFSVKRDLDQPPPPPLYHPLTSAAWRATFRIHNRINLFHINELLVELLRDWTSIFIVMNLVVPLFCSFFSVSCWLLTWVRHCDSTSVLPLACLEFSLEDYRCNFSPSLSSWQEGDTHFFPLLWFFTFQWMAKRCRLDVAVGSGTSMKILWVSL